METFLEVSIILEVKGRSKKDDQVQGQKIPVFQQIDSQ